MLARGLVDCRPLRRAMQSDRWPCLHNFQAYQSAAAAGGAVTLNDIPVAPTDQTTTIVNGHPIYPVGILLYAAYVVGATTITQAQLTTPKLRAINPCELAPIDASATETNRPPLVEFFHHPLSLNPIDENQMLFTTSGAAAQVYIGAWFGDGNWNVPQGDLFTIKLTASVTTVAQAWASGALTFATGLPSGRYAVVGMSCTGANGLFARLIFPNQVWRPGALCGTAQNFINSRYTRWGNLGVWGEFETFAIPQLEVYGNGAATSTFTCLLDIIRVR
jgi:hypothetical protein